MAIATPDYAMAGMGHRFDEERTYTVTELNQNTARVLEEITANDRPVALTRHGRFVAIIVPLVATEVESGVLTEGPLAERFLEQAQEVESTAWDSQHLLSDEQVETRTSSARINDTGRGSQLGPGLEEARIYTVTELNQNTARVIEEINSVGRPAAVTRYGQFLVAIVPLAGAKIESVVLSDGLIADRFLRDAQEVEDTDWDSMRLRTDEEVGRAIRDHR